MHTSFIGMKFHRSRRLADFPKTVGHARTMGELFDDGTVAATEKCKYVTGMVVYVRRWDDRPIIGGNTY